ncbi:Glycoside hydrolase family 2 immunoglobulin-like beta-sandwich [Penicillium cf. griseofulvum]|uniref:Glycoside hydrolase family 2 immunoglobulin-like beta-sandwich n=1 Tax=Penicillium cf. griseofulvum TaxID=2972120 RepID=A0A9W9M5L1_9EURO|nr:Glycoside hydrolase family 2 immunoglobulin-like beta-sandwich [Penicillium cf. griseofulvum]KAJ5422946.1 Glycoside hydrolase family 2 immunoglobulin-like beta-sandwich [Penicillium cf. griseofulvum]KAJ5433837.1 Glycoside hydrolase family 2 immunoglobulin-like beta-sandwich [Penicillium cf. griseofulvum]
MSWAMVDYSLVKNPAFYAISRALTPRDVGISRNCPVWTSGHADPMSTNPCEFDLWVASSRQEAIEVEVNMKFISIRTGNLVSDNINVTTLANPIATTEILGNQCVKLSTTCDSAVNKDLDQIIILAELYVRGLVMATDTAWPQPLKYLDFSNRNVRVETSKFQDEITATAALPVKGFVFEEREGLKLSDNGFDLVLRDKKMITVRGKGTKAADLSWTYVGANLCHLG